MTTITKYKLFWAWQDEKEEAWLHEMSRQGLHLQALPFPCIYQFETGAPRDLVYRMDYIVDRKDYGNYLQLFKDAGWEHLGEMGGWQYFRTETGTGTVPEIYTDPESKVQKYRRLMAILVVFLPLFIVMSTREVDPASRFAGLYMAGKFLISLMLILYAWALIMILRRIRELKQK